MAGLWNREGQVVPLQGVGKSEGGGCWQWERLIAPFPGANQTERVVNHEKGRFLWKCKGPSRGLKCWPCVWLCVSCVDCRRCTLIKEVWCKLGIKAKWNVSVRGDEGAGLWVVVWSKVDECVDEGDNTRVMWTEAHTTQEEEDNMSP